MRLPALPAAALLAAAAFPTPPDLLLAEVMPPDLNPAAYLVSEKFDGVRAYWDGRALWFRGGGRIPAPAWFLERLPPVPLDGELWMGRGRFEELSGEVRREQPREDAWRRIRYLVFELPGAPGPFEARARAIEALVARVGWPQLEAVAQTRVKDRAELQARLRDVLKAGGEGLMLHRADAPYATGRSDALLKLKPLLDAEAVVVGHIPGKGRLAGLVGALEVETPEGRRFRIGSGLTDALRRDPPPLGATITYTYRGLTRTGLPRFPAFLRLRTMP
ncbi:MAG TPA: DNA ligase [Holophaga sp.]|nr:DNA ligase [Holophaga sp.]